MIDHSYQKGYIVLCLGGELISEMTSCEQITLTAGGTYVVSDDLSSHRSMTERGVLLFMDGDFLKNRKLLYLITDNEPSFDGCFDKVVINEKSHHVGT